MCVYRSNSNIEKVNVENLNSLHVWKGNDSVDAVDHEWMKNGLCSVADSVEEG